MAYEKAVEPGRDYRLDLAQLDATLRALRISPTRRRRAVLASWMLLEASPSDDESGGRLVSD